MSPTRAAAGSTGTWQVALLRGVNVGPGKRVPMAALRACATKLGFTEVATLLNSGNLVYRTTRTPADAAAQLRAAIRTDIGVDTPVLVRTRAQLERLLRDNPMRAEAEENPSRFLVTVWDDDTTAKDLAHFGDITEGDDRFVVGRAAMYAWLPHGIAASKAYELASRPLKHRITARNWNTMQKLLAMMSDA